MAGSSLLEREIDKITCESEAAFAGQVSEAELAHRQMIKENFRRLIERDGMTSAEPARTEEAETFLDHAPAYQSPEYSAFDYQEPVVPSSYQAPSASNRIADYLAANRTLETLREQSGEQVRAGKPTLFSDEYIRNFMNPTPVCEAEVQASTYEEELYREGILQEATLAPEREAVEAPYYSASYMAETPVEQEDEDALPTRRTLETLEHGERAQAVAATGMRAGLSAKTKIILAALAATVVLMLAVICINTAVLNSIQAGLDSRQSAVTELSETLAGIEGEISDLTSPENIENWASDHGMTPPES